jgi:hypothetical protein
VVGCSLQRCLEVRGAFRKTAKGHVDVARLRQGRRRAMGHRQSVAQWQGRQMLHTTQQHGKVPPRPLKPNSSYLDV